MPSYEEKGGYKNSSLCSLHCQNAILSACVIIDEERNFEQRQMTVGYGYQNLETPEAKIARWHSRRAKEARPRSDSRWSFGRWKSLVRDKISRRVVFKPFH
jgi:hypothetical protein